MFPFWLVLSIQIIGLGVPLLVALFLLYVMTFHAKWEN